MATQIWLSNDDSDVSGYKVAYIGTRSPRASTTLSTAVTDTDGSTDLAMTATSGGTAIKWITAPFESAAVVAGSVVFNFWGLESNAAANSSLGVKLFEYTTSEQSVFCQTSYGTELGTSASQIQRSRQPAAVGLVDGATFTSTTIEAGNRLVVKPFISAVGTMGTGQRVTFDYNGATAGADGDSYIELTETILPDQVQFPANGASPGMTGGPNVIFLKGAREDLDPIVQRIASDDATWRVIKNELEYLEAVETA